MRILQLVYSCVPGNYRGGIPKIVFEISRHQAQLGHEVHICATNYNSSVPVDVPLDRVEHHEGVCLHYFNATSARRMRAASLQQYLMSNAASFDVLHSHNIFLPLNRYAAEAKRRTGVCLFNHTHGALDPVVVNQGYFKSLKKRVYIGCVERANLNASDAVIANTEHEEAQIRSHGVTAPIEIVPNGVLPPAIEPDSVERFRAQLNIPPDALVIAFIGRIVPKKGLHLLLRAFAQVAKSKADAVLVIAGDREQFPGYVNQLDQIVSEAGMQERVHWTGFLDESRKAGLLACAHVFFHVSESEGMAMSILEAMSAGVPTLVSTQCYMSSAAKHHALIELAATADDIEKALLHVFENESYRREIGRNAARFIKQHHRWDAVAETLLRLYAKAGT